MQTRLEIITAAKDIMNVDTSQPHQDFTDPQIVRTLQRVYEEEVHLAKAHSTKAHFLARQEVTWASGAVTFALPAGLSQHEIIEIRDVTDSSTGIPISVTADSDYSTIFWRDLVTLQYADSGPGADLVLAFFYYAEPENLSSDSSEPTLIPPEHRGLLVWALAVELRMIADEMAPPGWLNKLQDRRMQFWKVLGRGKPNSDAPNGQFASGYGQLVG